MNETIVKQIEELAKDTNRLSFLCNASSLINEKMNNVNWVGFYIAKKDALYLGPFQGKLACNKIGFDKGVCGKAFSNNEVLNVKNVKEFNGYIACDNDSKSELVIPLVYNNKKLGVLDIDSKVFNRFNEYDVKVLKQVSEVISKVLYKA